MNNKKNVILVFIIIAIYIFLNRNQQITNFFNNDESKINKVEITNGNTGELITTEDIKVISHISEYLSNIKLKRLYFQLPSGGWTYRLAIYENGKETINITFNGDEKCIINDAKYKVRKSTDITIESLYNEVNQ